VASHRVVVLDACVLYPAPLRDLLMHLLLAGLYQGRWSDAIHEEWISAVLEQRPDLTRHRLERTRALMDRVGMDCLVAVSTGAIGKIKGLPDADDAHVVAAAVTGKADTILTYNTRHFPARILEPLGIKAMTPDAFVSELLDDDPGSVCVAMRQHRATLKKPAKTVSEYLETLAEQKLTKAVQIIRSLGDPIQSV